MLWTAGRLRHTCQGLSRWLQGMQNVSSSHMTTAKLWTSCVAEQECVLIGCFRGLRGMLASTGCVGVTVQRVL